VVPSLHLAAIEQLKAAADVEIAEAVRASGDFDLAMSKYKPLTSLGSRPMLNMAALLGMAELSIVAGDVDQAAVFGAEQGARSAGIRHLEAAAIITSCRAGQRTVSETLQLLENFRDVVVGNEDSIRHLLTHLATPHAIYCVW
jgi:hypothetical protein